MSSLTRRPRRGRDGITEWNEGDEKQTPKRHAFFLVCRPPFHRSKAFGARFEGSNPNDCCRQGAVSTGWQSFRTLKVWHMLHHGNEQRQLRQCPAGFFLVCVGGLRSDRPFVQQSRSFTTPPFPGGRFFHVKGNSPTHVLFRGSLPTREVELDGAPNKKKKMHRGPLVPSRDSHASFPTPGLDASTA